MKLLAWVRSVASRFFHRSQTANEMDEELRAHIQMRADDLERAGLGRAEAERRARVEFGGYERYKEKSHEALGGKWIETFPAGCALQSSHAAQVSWICHRRSADAGVVYRS